MIYALIPIIKNMFNLKAKYPPLKEIDLRQKYEK